MVSGTGNPPTELWVVHVTADGGDAGFWSTLASRDDAYKQARMYRDIGAIACVYRFRMTEADGAAGTDIDKMHRAAESPKETHERAMPARPLLRLLGQPAPLRARAWADAHPAGAGT